MALLLEKCEKGASNLYSNFLSKKRGAGSRNAGSQVGAPLVSFNESGFSRATGHHRCDLLHTVPMFKLLRS